MAQGFNDNVKSLMAFNASAKYHKKIVYKKEVKRKVPNNMQNRYWNGIRLLLNHVKHLQPELSNMVRRL